MLKFGKYLLSEAVTLNGKKIGDDNDGDNTSSSDSNTTNSSISGGDYNVSSSKTANTTDASIPSSNNDNSANQFNSTSDNDDSDNDYTKLTPDGEDTTTASNTNASVGTDSSTTSTTSNTDETDDYTKLTPDNDTMGTGGNDDVNGENNQASTDSLPADNNADASGIPGGSDANSPPGSEGGGSADEPDTDYGELSPDNDDANNSPASGNTGDAASGNSDPSQPAQNQGETQGMDQATSGEEVNDPTQALRDLEAKLFSDLSPEQLQIKDNELKIQYINLYEDIEKTEGRVNRVVKTDNNEDVISFISKKLDELKNMIHNILTNTYQTQTYLQNMINYHHCLAIFSGIGEMLRNLASKDNINKNSKIDKLGNDIDSDVISGLTTSED